MKKAKKVVALILTLVLIICTTVTASANETETAEMGRMVSALTPEDLIIPKEAAVYIAEFFVRDMLNTGNVLWNEDTAVVDTVVMYDETGELPSAYSIELTEGYVVVSAYVDCESLIVEWSDEGAPACVQVDVPEGARVMYLSPVDYLIDRGNNTL